MQEPVLIKSVCMCVADSEDTHYNGSNLTCKLLSNYSKNPSHRVTPTSSVFTVHTQLMFSCASGSGYTIPLCSNCLRDEAVLRLKL